MQLIPTFSPKKESADACSQYTFAHDHPSSASVYSFTTDKARDDIKSASGKSDCIKIDSAVLLSHFLTHESYTS